MLLKEEIASCLSLEVSMRGEEIAVGFSIGMRFDFCWRSLRLRLQN